MVYRAVYDSDELAHHGIEGQKWGHRRFQNEDGSLTEAGLLRYRNKVATDAAKEANEIASSRFYNSTLKEEAGRQSFKIDLMVKEAIVKTADERKHLETSKELKTLDSWKEANNSTKNRNNAIGALAEDIYFQSKKGKTASLTLDDLSQDGFTAVNGDRPSDKFNGVNIMAYKSDPKNHENLIKKANRYDELLVEEMDAVDDYIDQYSDVPLASNSNWKKSASTVISGAVNKGNRNYYDYNLEVFNSQEQKSIDTASKIINYLPFVSNKQQGWWMFDRAVRDLGYDGTEKLSDLSEADWRKINERIGKISRK